MVSASIWNSDDKVKGIYLLLKSNEYPQDVILNKSFISGISVRVHWSDLEPLPEEFKWDYLDMIFNIARKSGKKVFLRILGGYWSPEWIYDKGVQKIQIEYKGQNIIFPVVWDQIYLKCWDKLIKALGQRYADRKELVLVHLSGPTVFSAEPILARNNIELNQLMEKGFTYDGIIKAWITTAGSFKHAFQRIPLTLNIHYIIKGNINLTERLVMELKGVLGRRLALQGNWLDYDYVNEHGDLSGIIKQLKIENGSITGFQTISSLFKRCRVKGMNKDETIDYIKKTFDLALDLNINYLEVYPVDVMPEFMESIFLKINKELLHD
jgi:hypothetical protein